MDITLTKDNWDEVLKILHDFIDPPNEIAICYYDYSEAYIGILFDDPRNGTIWIMGTTADDFAIPVRLGDVLEVYDTEIWFRLTEDDEVGLAKRAHTEQEKEICYTRRTPLLATIYNSVMLTPKAKSLSTLIASELFRRIPVPPKDGLRVVNHTIWFNPSENFHRAGLSMKDGVQLTLKVSLNYPKHPIKQFPSAFDPIGYTLIKEETDGCVVYRDEFFTYNYGELIMEMTRCLK